jgi:hypothetical protein
MLAHTFMSDRMIELKTKFKAERDQSLGNFICHAASRFAEWVVSLEKCDDDWLKCLAFFTHIAKDFFTFVESYRCGDAIGVEQGYENFIPTFVALGHHRYADRHWAQQEEFLVNHPYHCLEFSRRNCSVTTYHGRTGKNKQAPDEALETTNRLVEQLPTCNDRDAFSRQTNSLPLAKGGKRFVLGLNDKKELQSQTVYRSARKAKRQPEKTLLYEMLKLLGSSKCMSRQKVWL